MSKTTDRVERMLALIPYLNTRGSVPVAVAAQDFGVSEKTIKDDVKKLFMCGLPPGLPDDLIFVDYDALEQDDLIVLSNADFIDRPTRLFRSEALSILVALATLRSSMDKDERRFIDSLTEKLRLVLSDDSEPAVKVHSIDVDPDIKKAIENALAEGTCVRLTYISPYSETQTERDVEPLALRTRKGHMYAHAWCYHANAMRRFRLDRIVSVKPSDHEPRGIEKQIDIETFEPSDGDVWADFEVTGEINWLLEDYPMAEIRNMGKKKLLRMWSPADDWLVRFALSNAHVLTIVEPTPIVERVTAEARAALSAYDGEPN